MVSAASPTHQPVFDAHAAKFDGGQLLKTKDVEVDGCGIAAGITTLICDECNQRPGGIANVPGVVALDLHTASTCLHGP